MCYRTDCPVFFFLFSCLFFFSGTINVFVKSSGHSPCYPCFWINPPPNSLIAFSFRFFQNSAAILSALALLFFNSLISPSYKSDPLSGSTSVSDRISPPFLSYSNSMYCFHLVRIFPGCQGTLLLSTAHTYHTTLGPCFPLLSAFASPCHTQDLTYFRCPPPLIQRILKFSLTSSAL